MNVEEKERLIKKDIESIENKVRHAFNQGYEMGMKDREKLNCTDCIIEKSGDFIKSRSEIPNTCGDAISRQAVDDAIYDYSRSCDVNYQQIMEFIEKIPSVTPQPCEDAISRQEALNAITMAEVRWQAVDNVNKLPSVTPQQRTGRWIKQNYGWNWQCSECGFVTPPSAKEIFTFCPKCGCKMEVEE